MARSCLNIVVGQRYGELLVIERASNHPRGHAMWRCLCSCGNEKIAQASRLNDGRTRSCGHIKRQSHVLIDGKKKCSKCGKTKEVGDFYHHSGFSSGFMSACKECNDRKQNEQTPESWAFRLVRRTGAKSSRKHIDQSKIAKVIADGFCQVSGIRFDLAIYKHHDPASWRNPSLDQIFPSGGYAQENVRVVCRGVNVMMLNWGIGPILQVADGIRATHQPDAETLRRAV